MVIFDGREGLSRRDLVQHQVYAMPAQFSVDASIKGAERVTFAYFSVGTAYTRTVSGHLNTHQLTGFGN